MVQFHPCLPVRGRFDTDFPSDTLKDRTRFDDPSIQPMLMSSSVIRHDRSVRREQTGRFPHRDLPPLVRASAGRGGDRALPRHPVRHRPAHRRRLLLRLPDRPFTPEDLVAIEKKMAHIVKQNRPIEKKLLPKAEALGVFAEKGQTLKCQLIEEKAGEMVQCYTMGPFIDFCRGPHVPTTEQIKAFKLNPQPSRARTGGATRNPSMQRIYGTAFLTQGGARRSTCTGSRRRRSATTASSARSSTSSASTTRPAAGSSSGIPKGGVVRKQHRGLLARRALRSAATSSSSRRTSAQADLWETSGHLDFYRENMYSPMEIEDVRVPLKPMNCPVHILIYKTTSCAATATCRCARPSSAPSTATSAPACCTACCACAASRRTTRTSSARPSRSRTRSCGVLDFAHDMLRTFGFDRYDVVALRRGPSKSVGTRRAWEMATAALKRRSRAPGIDATRSTRATARSTGRRSTSRSRTRSAASGSAPRSSSTSTCPSASTSTYIGEDGKAHRPIMVHRALLGSLERFFGVLIEHYAGALPGLARAGAGRSCSRSPSAQQRLRAQGGRESCVRRASASRSTTATRSSATRSATPRLQKIPYMLVVGDKEAGRRHGRGAPPLKADLGAMPVAAFAAKLSELVATHNVNEEPIPVQSWLKTGPRRWTGGAP